MHLHTLTDDELMRHAEIDPAAALPALLDRIEELRKEVIEKAGEIEDAVKSADQYARKCDHADEFINVVECQLDIVDEDWPEDAIAAFEEMQKALTLYRKLTTEK